MQLKLIANGLSTAFAPTLAGTLDKLAAERAPFFLNEAFIDRDYRPQLCAFRDNRAVSQFDERARALLDEALDDLVERHEGSAANRIHGGTAALVLVLPEVSDSEGLDRDALGRLGAGLCDRIAEVAADALGLRIGARSIRASGHAGVGSVLAETLGTEPSDEIILIAAVDSYSDRSRLNRLNEDRRLFSKKTQFGFVPGEAAGLMLFAPVTETDSEPSGLIVCGAGNAIETVTELLEDESRFNALSDSAFAACENVLRTRDRRIAQWYADWNNSRYRATELAFAMHRINPFFLSNGLEPSYPTLHFGDVGAAFGSVALALVDAGLSRPMSDEEQPPPPPAYALISAGSTLKGLRSTMLVTKQILT